MNADAPSRIDAPRAAASAVLHGAFEAAAGPDAAQDMRRIAQLRLQRLTAPADLDGIVFEEGLATIEFSAELLPHIRFKNARRGDEARLETLMRRIERDGYVPLTPVICRIGRKGKWVVVDGGHRLSALKRLYQRSWRRRLASWLRSRARRFPPLARLARWIGGRPDMVYAILFLGPRSLSRIDAPK